MHAGMSIRIPDNRCLHGNTANREGTWVQGEVRTHHVIPLTYRQTLCLGVGTLPKTTEMVLLINTECVCTRWMQLSGYRTHFNCPGIEQHLENS